MRRASAARSGRSSRWARASPGLAAPRIGVVDAIFVDYLLVRTAGLPPVDLYVPTADIEVDGPRRARVAATRAEAYERWHRPLKSVAHD